MWILMICLYLVAVLANLQTSIKCYKRVPRTIKHYFAFLKTEKRLLGYYKYKFHDLDKLIMYLTIPFIGKDTIQEIHYERKHHIYPWKEYSECDYLEAIINWECGRFTKPDQSLNARQFYEHNKFKIGIHHGAYIEVQLQKLEL